MTGRQLYFLAGAVIVLALAAAALFLGAGRGGAQQAQTGAAAQPSPTAAAGAATTTAASPAGTTTVAVIGETTVAAVEKPRITVYVYEDFMAWGEDPRLFDKLVENFTKEYGVEVNVVKFDGAKAMVSQVIAAARAGKPLPDVVIGVDAATVAELKKEGLLECYLAKGVPGWLVEALDPGGCVTPIDYGVIALVYDPGRLSEKQLEMLRDGVTLDELIKLANVTVAEDPTQSSTGLNFLLYTVAVSEAEGRDWRSTWKAMKENGLMVAKSWGDAYDEFFREGSRRAIVVSYGTDPAYSAWYNSKEGGGREPSVGAAFLALSNGTTVAWLQVEGVALVKGASPEARRFVDWLLSPEVQRLIPGSNWMFPAREGVELPWYYEYALRAEDAGLLGNHLLPGNKVVEELQQLLTEWLQVMSSG